MITLGGLLPIVSLLEHPIVPLLYKAHTAAVLLRFILPDSLWKDSSALAGHHARTRPITAASLAASLAGATLNGQTSPGLPPPTTSIADHSQQAPAPAVASDHAPSASATVANGSVSAQAGSIATTTGAHGGSVPRPSTASMGRASDALDPPLPDEQLMDDATKADIIKRARLTLVNLSMTPSLMPRLQLYQVPDYIHGGNIPQRHFERPFPSTGIVEAGLAQVPEHLAGARKDMQSAGSRPGGPNFTGGAARPPALKPRS
ncbi:uncharacterized protein HaLaN_17128 [Haematococcus lacustris]|uniref:Uncharacterized protein n=1 Tax=Haematococcus lacustris TaxID=44745 RepID=A0A699ZBK6_HAELA|nr:uncharacterized protein HaLaN_17128 [Haematococcus lacustris]